MRSAGRLDAPEGYGGSAAAGQRLEQDPGELRALAGLLVLEVDEHVPARRGARTDRSGPAPEVLGRVALIAKPEVGVGSGDLDRRRELLAVRHAQGDVRGLQARDHL